MNKYLNLLLVSLSFLASGNVFAEKFSFSFDEVSNNFVIITSDTGGKGSGFLTNMDGATYVLTNQHVIMGSKKFTIKDMSNNLLKLESIEIAPGRDIARIKLTENKDNLLNMAKKVSMNSKIVVYGNSGGADVVTEIYGNVTGVGPDRIEVSAKFIPGNSGSPILNNDREVVGIATYALINQDANALNVDSKFNKIRRFGYKITPNIKWENVNWRKYSALGKKINEDKEYIGVLIEILNIWGKQPYQKLTLKKKAHRNLHSWVQLHNREYDKYDAQYKKLVKKARSGRLTDRNVQKLIKKMQAATLKGGKHLTRWCNTRRSEAKSLQKMNKSAAFMDGMFERNSKTFEALAEEFTNSAKIHSERDPFRK